jgi:hypothetical protein
MPRSAAQKAKRKAKKVEKRSEQKIVNRLVSSGVKAGKKQSLAPKALAINQSRKVISGHGDYVPESSMGKKLSKLAGQGADFLGTLFGSGDYHKTLRYNTVMGVGGNIMAAGGPPIFANVGPNKRSVRFPHREFIGFLNGTTTFVPTSYGPFNPVNPLLFPWLSGVANSFEQFKFHGMVVEFVSNSGDTTATTALGTVIMSTQYDLNEAPFVNQFQMENYEYTQSDKPSVSFLHGLECAVGETFAPLKFMNNNERTGAVVDLNTTALGTFTIATSGNPSTGVLGQIWVSYDVELVKPRIAPIINSNYEFEWIGAANMTQTNTIPTDVTSNVSGGTCVSVSGAPGVFSVMGLYPTVAGASSTSLPGLYQSGYIVVPAFMQGHEMIATINISGTGLGSLATITSATTDVAIASDESGSSALDQEVIFDIVFAPVRAVGATGNYLLRLTGPNNTTLTGTVCRFLIVK